MNSVNSEYHFLRALTLFIAISNVVIFTNTLHFDHTIAWPNLIIGFSFLIISDSRRGLFR